MKKEFFGIIISVFFIESFSIAQNKELNEKVIVVSEKPNQEFLAFQDNLEKFNTLPEIQTLRESSKEESEKILNRHGIKNITDIYKNNNVDFDSIHQEEFEYRRHFYYEAKKVSLPEKWRKEFPITNFDTDFFLCLTGYKKALDTFFENPKWYAFPSTDFQKELLSDLKDAQPGASILVLQEGLWFPPNVDRRIYGVISFLIGDNKEGKRMMDELLSMAKGTSEKKYSEFDMRQSAVAWVWLNDILLGSEGIYYGDSQWYVDNIDTVDPVLRNAFESRIKWLIY